MVKIAPVANPPRELRSKYKNEWVGIEQPLRPDAALTLPTKKDVLSSFLYFSKQNKKSKGNLSTGFDSATITAIAIDQIWLKASLVPTTLKSISNQVQKLYDSYKKIRDTPKKQRTGPTYLKRAADFKQELKSLFNVFSGKTLFKETEDEELEFLTSISKK